MAEPGILQTLPFTQALDYGLIITRRYFRQIYLAVALPLTLCATLLVVIQMLVLQPLMDPATFAAMEDPTFSFLGCGALGIVLAAYLGIWVISQGVIFFAAADAVEGRPIRMGQIWRSIFRPSVLATLLLVYLAISFGTMLCILPGLAAYAFYLWSLPVMRSEGRVGFDALARSSQLARHRPPGGYAAGWKVLGAGLMGFVLQYLTSMLAQLPFQIVIMPLQIRQQLEGGGSSPAMWLNVPMTLLGTLVMMAVAIYVGFAQVVLYIDTRRRAEGGDLEAAVDGLYALHGLALERATGEPAAP